MDRSKWVAVVTGAVSLLLAIAYLLLVQLLDFRGDMIPAPVGAEELDTPGQAISAGVGSAGAGVFPSGVSTPASSAKN